MIKKIKVISILVISSLLISTLSACSTNKEKEVANTFVNEVTEISTIKTEYPLATDETLSYWLTMPTTLKTSIQDIPFYQEWQKRTGVKINFVEVPGGQSKDVFSVLLAAGNLPDIIEYDWLHDTPGGPAKMIGDGYILKLNGLLEKNAPNLKKYLNDNPDVDKMVKTDNGEYYELPFLKGNLSTLYQGPLIRKDWLDEFGLSIPTTIDDWYNALKVFKDKKHAKAPLSVYGTPAPLQGFLNGAFIGAFGVIRGFYVDNGKVKFGPAETGYRDFLSTLNKWYKEGLLDKNFTLTDGKALDANITSGASGATVHSGATADKWLNALKSKDPKANLIGVPYPVIKKGDKPKFGQKDFTFTGFGAAISAKSKNSELAVKVLDFAYSEEGNTLFNFGVEGHTYKLVNGYPKYTNIILNNPDKLSPVEAMSLYLHTVNKGPYYQDDRFMEQFSTGPSSQSIVTWKTDNLKYVLPPVTITDTDSADFARITAEVNTLVDETSLKIITGSTSVDFFDKYLEQLKSINLSRLIEIQQAAYDRYIKR